MHKTSAYYAVAPFVGSFLAFIVNGEKLEAAYFIGLALMMVGTVFVVYDTKLSYKIERYEEALKTGKLSWKSKEEFV